MAILVTGAAGFVGSYVAARLLDRGEAVVGLDSFNAYYDPALKRARAARLEGRPGFRMVGGSVAGSSSRNAATKRSGELMSTAYARLYGLPQTGLRFFTVYGPWGRPDMAYFGFTEAIAAGRPIRVFGEGRMARDFTWIDDIAEGVVLALDRPPAAPENRILNIGGGRPVGLMDMIAELERALGREAVKVFEPMQPGDVTRTGADVSRLQALTGWSPTTPISEGLPRFVEWWREFYGR